MELFRNTNINFMKYRKYWIVISLILLAVGIFSVFVHGKLNIGIDFAGGTQLTVKFAEDPEVDNLRALLEGAGVEDAQIQSFGEAGENEVLIKTPTLEGSQEGSRDKVVDALDGEYNAGSDAGLDLNRDGREDIAQVLVERDPDGLINGPGDADAAKAHYEGVAEAILEVRRENGLIVDWSEVESAPAVAVGDETSDLAAGAAGVSPEVAQVLRQEARLGNFSVIGVENVGPQMGAELRQKGILAVLLSLVGMLLYIWFRFELRFGIGALMASMHDVLVALGIFALLGFEFNLTTIAAFLTLIGYSVNDTVVIFDRVRENMQARPSAPLLETMNKSLNDTLSRTVLTSGTTFLTAASLFFLGGDVLRGFSFVLMMGVVIGTYSSIYIASPFALLWENMFSDKARAERAKAKRRAA